MNRRLSTASLSAMLAIAILAPSRGADDFPAPYDSEPAKEQPMPAQKRPGRSGSARFQVGVFAAEPDVRNPIAMAWDARGRLWIAENYTYAERARKFDLGLRDRVLIFEDRDGDGRFDRRSVFTDGPQRLTSLEVGRGGAWLFCPPQVLFIPDRDGDDKPAGRPRSCSTASPSPRKLPQPGNGLRWGPDGWLYGRCGASAPGSVGIPGTPEAQRTPLRGGLCGSTRAEDLRGAGARTTKPLGPRLERPGRGVLHQYGERHLWHAVAGMHFVRPHTIDPNRASTRRSTSTPTLALGQRQGLDRLAQGQRRARPPGGGHAHTGAMIYLGGQWPADYRDKLFTLNLHGRRVNVDRLERSGCGYIGRHDPDMIFSGDTWFPRPRAELRPRRKCLHARLERHRRVPRGQRSPPLVGADLPVTYGTPKPSASDDLSRLDERALVALQEDPNEWYVRQARQVLAGRAARARSSTPPVRPCATGWRGRRPGHLLRALWALNADRRGRPRAAHAAGRPRSRGRTRLGDPAPDRRDALDDILSRRPGRTPRCRPTCSPCSCGGTRGRLGVGPPGAGLDAPAAPVGRRASWRRRSWPTPRTPRHDVPLLLWYGLIPLADADSPASSAGRGLRAADDRRLIARCLAESIETNPEPIGPPGLASSRRPTRRPSRPTSSAGSPTGYAAAARPPARRLGDAGSRLGAGAEAPIRDRVRELSVVFGDGRVLDEVRRLVLDDSAGLDLRRRRSRP